MKYNLQPFDREIVDKSEVGYEEVNEIIEEIKETAFGLRTEQEIKLYIQNHQSALIEQKRFDVVSDKCDRVLYFIETHFRNYVNDKFLLSELGKTKRNRYTDLIPIEHIFYSKKLITFF